MSDDSNGMSRRRVLSGVGIGGGALLAGWSNRVLSTEGARSASSDDHNPDSPKGGVQVYKDVTYAVRDSGELKLDLYVPKGARQAPLVVWIHGGGWLANTRKTAPDLEWYAQQGFTMATISHRLSEIPEEMDPPLDREPNNPTPDGVFPDHIIDVKAAIRWLRANADEYGYNADTVATWGRSSGAHLAALAGTMNDIEDVKGDVYTDADIEKEVAPDESGRVQAVVAWFPPTDLLKMDTQLEELGLDSRIEHNAPDSPESLLIGGQLTEYPERAERANPITYVSPDDPPFLLMHGREDVTVPYLQSKMLYDALVDVDIEATFYELHNLGHGFGDNENMDEFLMTDPRPAQSVNVLRHHDPGPSDVAVEALPPAGPEAITGFFDRHLES